MALVEDKSIYPLMVSLSACLCTALQERGGPALCYCGPVAGPSVLDYCGNDTCDGNGCGGQAWVRLLDAFPSSVFPSLDGNLQNCKSPFAYTLEVGVARCAPVGTATGAGGYTPPSMSDQLEAMRLQTADIAALRTAIQCCFGGNEYDYVMGIYDQSQVNGGGCLGGAFTVVVWETF